MSLASLRPTWEKGLGDEGDPYALLYSDRVVDVINELNLPRYGLGNFVSPFQK